MTRAEIIAVANAALRLGDFFVPPTGTRVRVLDPRATWDAIVEAGASDSTEIRIISEEFWGVTDDPHAVKLARSWLDGSDLFELLDFDRVEGELPPLEDWPRPTAEDFNRSVGAERWRR